MQKMLVKVTLGTQNINCGRENIHSYTYIQTYRRNLWSLCFTSATFFVGEAKNGSHMKGCLLFPCSGTPLKEKYINTV